EGILVEALDPAGKFDAADEVNRDAHALAARLIQEVVLNVVLLRCFFHAFRVPPRKSFVYLFVSTVNTDEKRPQHTSIRPPRVATRASVSPPARRFRPRRAPRRGAERPVRGGGP